MSEAAADGGFRPLAGPLRLHSDERLVRRAVEGDERAFAAIYRRYSQDLYRFCLAILGDPQDAQDALQNAMVKAMRALPGERREIQLKPWLYRIAHNESIEMLRRRPPTDQLDPELAAGAAGPAEKAEQRARLQRLVADLGQLPDRQRGVLVMRELAGLGFEEIGTALGTSPAVARQTLYEARLSLRQMEEGRELSCDAVTRALSDADGRVTRRRDIRAHLRDCSGCREFRDELRRRHRDFAAVAPLPAAAAAGILQGIIGAGGASGGGIAAGAAGSAAAGKALGGAALGTSAVVKSAATVAVVAAIGAGAADRGGLVNVGLPGGAGSDSSSTGVENGSSPAGAGSGGAGSPSEGGSSDGADGREAGGQKSGGSRQSSGGRRGGGAAGGAQQGPRPKGARGASAGHRNDSGARGNSAAAAHGQETSASDKSGAAAKGGSKKGESGNKAVGNGGRAPVTGGPQQAPPAQPTTPEPSPKPEPPPKSEDPAVPEAAGGGRPEPPSDQSTSGEAPGNIPGMP